MCIAFGERGGLHQVADPGGANKRTEERVTKSFWISRAPWDKRLETQSLNNNTLNGYTPTSESPAVMEEDRAVADLKPDIPVAEETIINGDAESISKAPKRRFIGRKAADANAAVKAEASDGSIEETGAVQGAVGSSLKFHLAKLIVL